MRFFKLLKVLRKIKKLSIEADSLDYYISVEKNNDEKLYQRYEQVEKEKVSVLNELWNLYGL